MWAGGVSNVQAARLRRSAKVTRNTNPKIRHPSSEQQYQRRQRRGRRNEVDTDGKCARCGRSKSDHVGRRIRRSWQSG